MVGKAALFLIMGFSLIFLVLGQNFSRLSVQAFDNFTQYHDESVAYNIAVSGANIAANNIFLNQSWTTGLNNVSFQGGKINVSVQVLDAFKNLRQITATGVYYEDTSTVKVTLQPSKFSKFAYYSVYEPSGIWWANGDTVWGPMHTQDYLRVAGHPVFNGKVTTKKGLQYYTSKKYDSPILNGGYQSGVDLPLPSTGVADLETEANSGGHTFTGHDTVYITFAVDSIKYRFSYKGTVTTKLASDLAPNGVLFADNAVLRLQGTVKGQYTVGASGSSGKGNIYLDDNVTYNTDPNTNPNSTDILGIVAKNNVFITDNYPNRHDITIDGAIYCETGGFGAQNYASRPNSGIIHLNGGITQYQRQAVGTFNYYGNIVSGFSKNYRYDERLMYSSPPNFPNTGSFEIVSWYEQNTMKNNQ